MQTIWGAAGARFHRVAFIRERVTTPDGDFVDFDWTAPGLFADRSADNRKVEPDPALAHTAARRWLEPPDQQVLNHARDIPALVLFHGLEGSSQSRYAQSIAHYFRARGWIVVVAHFRGCSGFPNRMARAYYSGDTDEIGFILAQLKSKVPNAKWHAAGVSLGGNALVKYLGENAESTHWLHACTAISVPLDLVAAGEALSRTPAGRQVYSRYFLKSMITKIREKAQRFPGITDTFKLGQVKTIRDFDDLYTAPMHGYKNALDYWTRASAKPVLKSVSRPTLILNARNDPFIPEASLPGTSECSDAILLHQPAQGGHVGFITGGFPGNLNWLPNRMANYFERLT
ncbi:YheT family hydrolase [Neopusillimonas maritima]|jgi:hypothetical protein|uniref:Alpha/beta hydrolase n=1 Tax=Neopusillimonas maritima TaxID=2026239 RepID=A0ABX9N212_9BURK|nr:alpha/beta fold hydrolase [Neopusillimonas maritima]MAL01498.1 alpha/beta hydrolase [Alcaligenaceae bacterium]RII84271.1 alpha/beta hydrolase [Neopusillimonas maritima]